MSTPRQENDIESGGPATYRIVVQGSLSSESARLLAAEAVR